MANSHDRFQLFGGLRRAVELLRGRKELLAQSLDDVSDDVLNGALEHVAELETLLDDFGDRFAIQLVRNRARYATTASSRGTIPL